MTFLPKSITKTRRLVANLLQVTDFSISTWLVFGAVLQVLSQSWLPRYFSLALPFVYLIYRGLKLVYDCQTIFTSTFTNVVKGRATTILPQAGSDAPAGVVMFLLGARINHPLGKLAPGAKELGDMFDVMWKECDENREKWGYLGRAPTLMDTSDAEGTTMFWLTYWTSLEKLQAFSACAAHRVAQNAYNAKKFPYIGVMHETYCSPSGSWETIYHDMPPTAFGQAKYIVNDEKVSSSTTNPIFRNTLSPLKSGVSMFTRMRREDANANANARAARSTATTITAAMHGKEEETLDSKIPPVTLSATSA